MNKEEIEHLSDKFFPFKKDGIPQYREHQKDTIVKICEEFLIKEKKFVAVEGPVGCGKSVINYTVARIIGTTTYLTPLKMLQDQITKEKWEGVKMIKGKGSYCCNHMGYDQTSYRCGGSGNDNIETCHNNAPKVKINNETMDKIIEEVSAVHQSFGNNEYLLGMKSGFENSRELTMNVDKLRSLIEEDRIAREIEPDEYDLEYAIGCSMSTRECPVKASRTLARFAPMRVLNPDIFFYLNRGMNSPYSHSKLMVYDECQQIENVISRLFKMKLPIDTIKELFGVDLGFLYDSECTQESMKKVIKNVLEVLAPISSAANVIAKMSEVLTVRNFATFSRMQSKNKFAEAMRKAGVGDYLFKMNREDRQAEISILDMLADYFADKSIPPEFKQMCDLANNLFNRTCENKYQCNPDHTVFQKIRGKGKPERTKNKMVERLTRPLKSNEEFDVDDIWISPDFIYADDQSVLYNLLDDLIVNIMNLIAASGDDLPAFMISKTTGKTLDACKGTLLYDRICHTDMYFNKKERCMEIVPVDVGRIMGRFFYSKSDKVLLTSGTWVGPHSLFKIYGLPGDTTLVKIPSTFDPSQRRIFVVDNKDYTNFSYKDSNNFYLYKTPEGIKKFCAEVDFIIKRLRVYIRKELNENTNIIIHCHTFDIAKKIAGNSTMVDNNFLVHLPRGSYPIRNEPSGNSVPPMSKNELIQRVKSNPNSGMVLVSPSISEGVDFKDKIARAQIMLKRPIPYLGDAYVQAYYKGNPDIGIERDRDYLDRVCFTILTQQYGRVMRAENDFGVTVVMDQSITGGFREMINNKKRAEYLNIDYIMQGVQFKQQFGQNPEFTWFE